MQRKFGGVQRGAEGVEVCRGCGGARGIEGCRGMGCRVMGRDAEECGGVCSGMKGCGVVERLQRDEEGYRGVCWGSEGLEGC